MACSILVSQRFKCKIAYSCQNLQIYPDFQVLENEDTAQLFLAPSLANLKIK